MTKFESFRKTGNRYESAPFRSCSDPSRVAWELASELANRYLHRSEYVKRVTRNRCPYCNSFDEITFYWAMPNGDKFKTVYTVPAM